jgi:hypothetical protein
LQAWIQTDEVLSKEAVDAMMGVILFPSGWLCDGEIIPQDTITKEDQG